MKNVFFFSFCQQSLSILHFSLIMMKTNETRKSLLVNSMAKYMNFAIVVALQKKNSACHIEPWIPSLQIWQC